MLKRATPSSSKSRGRMTAAAARAKSPARRKRNRAGRPTADELERRKRRVMEVATDMFVNRGYAAVSRQNVSPRRR